MLISCRSCSLRRPTCTVTPGPGLLPDKGATAPKEDVSCCFTASLGRPHAADAYHLKASEVGPNAATAFRSHREDGSSSAAGTMPPGSRASVPGPCQPKQQHCKARRRGSAPAAALVVLVTACCLSTAAAVRCTVFKPTGCWYATALPPSEEPLVYPRCAFR